MRRFGLLAIAVTVAACGTNEVSVDDANIISSTEIELIVNSCESGARVSSSEASPEDSELRVLVVDDGSANGTECQTALVVELDDAEGWSIVDQASGRVFELSNE